jgi:hypothetical protein
LPHLAAIQIFKPPPNLLKVKPRSHAVDDDEVGSGVKDPFQFGDLAIESVHALIKPRGAVKSKRFATDYPAESFRTAAGMSSALHNLQSIWR